MFTSEVLNKAADLIEQDGWTRGPGGMEVGGAHCIQGAIQAAMDAPRWISWAVPKYHYLDAAPCAAGDAVRDYLDASNCERVWMWNDNKCEGGHHAIEVLRAAALIESAREDQDAAFATYAQNVAVVS